MLSHLTKIAWRNILKRRGQSLINIFGLTISITNFCLVAAFVWQEFQVNQQLKNIDQQYILQSQWREDSMGLPFTTIAALPRALQKGRDSISSLWVI